MDVKEEPARGLGGENKRRRRRKRRRRNKDDFMWPIIPKILTL